jgi:hypothetical protein
MVRFRFGNEQVRPVRVPFPGGITRHSLRVNPDDSRLAVWMPSAHVEVT